MTRSADSINAAVARIAGISKKLFEDTRDKREMSEEEKINQGVYGLDLPKEHEMPPKKAKGNVDDAPDYDDDEDEVKGAQPGKGGKMEARGPDSSPAASMKRFMRKAGKFSREMADPYSDENRASALSPKDKSRERLDLSKEMGSPRLPESKEMKMEDVFKAATGCPLTEWKRLAGLDEDHSGEVPTAGVNKQNKMKAGLPGLEGETVQPIEPTEGPEGEDHVGDSKEVTFDDAIAMLKKEGVDVDALWGEFLENRGLTVALFNQLVDEAIQGEDPAEMDALLAVEGIFYKELPQLLPEGLRPFAEAYVYPTADVDRASSEAAVKIKQHGPEKVMAMGKMGLDPGNPAHHEMFKTRLAKLGLNADDPEHIKAHLARTAKPMKVPGIGGRGPLGSEADDESWAFEADDDGTGNPVMPWMNRAAESVIGRLSGKYLGEAKAKLGSGSRFKQVEKSVAKNPKVKDPAAVAAAIGRKKFGAKKMAQLSAKGRRQG